MADTPSFGRYAEIPFDRMTPEQQEGYGSLIETRGQLGGPSRIWVHIPGSQSRRDLPASIFTGRVLTVGMRARDRPLPT